MFRQQLLGHSELDGTHKRGINRVITVRHKLDLHCHCGLINVLSEGLRGVAALLSNGTDVVFSSPIKQQETEEIMYLTVLWGIKKTGAWHWKPETQSAAAAVKQRPDAMLPKGTEDMRRDSRPGRVGEFCVHPPHNWREGIFCKERERLCPPLVFTFVLNFT